MSPRLSKGWSIPLPQPDSEYLIVTSLLLLPGPLVFPYVYAHQVVFVVLSSLCVFSSAGVLTRCFAAFPSGIFFLSSGLGSLLHEVCSAEPFRKGFWQVSFAWKSSCHTLLNGSTAGYRVLGWQLLSVCEEGIAFAFFRVLLLRKVRCFSRCLHLPLRSWGLNQRMDVFRHFWNLLF